MAIEISATVFVNEVKTLDFGWVLKCSHSHRFKNDQDEWETASYTNIDLIINKRNAEEFMELTTLESGSRISFTGYGKSVAYLKKDGTPGSSLSVEPTSYEVLTKHVTQQLDTAPF